MVTDKHLHPEQFTPSQIAPRAMSRVDAAHYLGIGVTLFSTLNIPGIRIGRRVVYDRYDLDQWFDWYKKGGIENTNKEQFAWQKQAGSTDGRTQGTGGLTLSSQVEKEYEKVLGLNAKRKRKPLSHG